MNILLENFGPFEYVNLATPDSYSFAQWLLYWSFVAGVSIIIYCLLFHLYHSAYFSFSKFLMSLSSGKQTFVELMCFILSDLYILIVAYKKLDVEFSKAYNNSNIFVNQIIFCAPLFYFVS